MLQLSQSAMSKKILEPITQDLTTEEMSCMYFQYKRKQAHATEKSVCMLQLHSMINQYRTLPVIFP
jgi:hypothetical protein